MNQPALWPESYPNVVERAYRDQAEGRYAAASGRFLEAASLAPDPETETFWLKGAWWCERRALGLTSRLE